MYLSGVEAVLGVEGGDGGGEELDEEERGGGLHQEGSQEEGEEGEAEHGWSEMGTAARKGIGQAFMGPHDDSPVSVTPGSPVFLITSVLSHY